MAPVTEFRNYALAHKMELEVILAEIYTGLMQNRTDFAMFDGGAHKGYHTLRMLALPGCRRVFAVEADPAMAQHLEDTLEREAPGDTRVMLVKKALQRDPAIRSIPWRSSFTHQGRSSILSANSTRPTIWHGNKEMEYHDISDVEAATIDQIVGPDGHHLGFIKLDLEGADLHALFGASRTLALHRPMVAFENSVHAPEVHGFTIADVMTYFDKLDYVPIDMYGDVMTQENWFGFFEAWAAPREQANWLSYVLKTALAQRGFGEAPPLEAYEATANAVVTESQAADVGAGLPGLTGLGRRLARLFK